MANNTQELVEKKVRPTTLLEILKPTRITSSAHAEGDSPSRTRLGHWATLVAWASNFVSTMTANADRNGKQEQNPHKCAKNRLSRNKDELKCISYLTSIPDFLDSAQWRGSIDPSSTT